MLTCPYKVDPFTPHFSIPIKPASVRRRPSVRPPFSKIFFSETAWPIKAKFHVEPPWESGTSVRMNDFVHMTKMAATSIYGKNLKKNLLLQNRKSYDLETWHAASVQSLHKW